MERQNCGNCGRNHSIHSGLAQVRGRFKAVGNCLWWRPPPYRGVGLPTPTPQFASTPQGAVRRSGPLAVIISLLLTQPGQGHRVTVGQPRRCGPGSHGPRDPAGRARGHLLGGLLGSHRSALLLPDLNRASTISPPRSEGAVVRSGTHGDLARTTVRHGVWTRRGEGPTVSPQPKLTDARRVEASASGKVGRPCQEYAARREQALPSRTGRPFLERKHWPYLAVCTQKLELMDVVQDLS